MAKAKPILQFMSQISKAKSERLTEVGIRIDIINKSLKTSPKPNYSINDVVGYLEESKRTIQDLMSKTFEWFTQIMLPVIKGGSFGQGNMESSTLYEEDINMANELTRLKAENERLKREASVAQAQMASSRTQLVNVAPEQMLELRNQINQRDIELQKRDFQIQKLTVDLSHAQETSQNYQIRISQNESKLNEYTTRLATLQADTDSFTRQKAYLQEQLDSSTREIKSYRAQIDDLQISLARKDREIADLKEQLEEITELEQENEKLRQAVFEAAEKIKKSSLEIKDAQEQGRRDISRKEEELRAVNLQLEKLREEKEILLIDSQETSKTVDYYRTEFEKVQSELQKNKSEMEALEIQLNLFMSGAASPSGQVQQATDPLRALNTILQSDAESEKLAEVQNQLTIRTEERNRAQAEAKKFATELTTLNSEIAELNRVIDRLRADKAGLERELETIKRELELELKQREKAQETANKYRLERNDFEKKYQDSLSEREGLTSSIETMKHEYERKLKSTDDLDNRIKDLRAEREKLEEQLSELSRQLKKQERETRDSISRIQALEQEVLDREQKLAQTQKEFYEESKAKTESKQKLESVAKELEEVRFKLNQQLQASTAEEAERSKLLETISEYRLRESGLNKQISQMENKIADLVSKLDTLMQELNLKEKQIEIHLARQKELNELINKLRLEIDELSRYRDEAEGISSAKAAEIESFQRHIAKLERDTQNLELTLNERKRQLDEAAELNIKLSNQMTEKERQLRTEISSLTNATSKEIEKLQNNLKREKELSEYFKRSLEEDPKFLILIILNEVRKASCKELERATARQPVIVKRILKGLEGEGWVKLSADEEAVEMVKNFPPL